MNATLDIVYAGAVPPPPHVEPERLIAGEANALADIPSGAFINELANSAARPFLTDSGRMISIELTRTRISPFGAELSVQEDRIDARTRAPAEPDLRRLKKAEIEVERRIVTLKERVTN